MEGDVMVGAVNWPALLAIGGALLGGIFALLKWFAGRLLADIEARLIRIDDLESRFERLMAELPLHYQRREDFVREMQQADSRYQRIVESVIEAMREEVALHRRRIEDLEKQRETDVMRYQRRDDAIREYTSLNAKIDRVYEVLVELKHDR
ncbi:hypothetical protein [Thermomonas haemolytica]|uniref:Uncharacterized protein n=1 Tax=Thermomonas haemolytica TaxID=141949 RepID=A0A4R3NB50_9GAMM|nr:hypothetical protein [Thermomonas haemolytica]TCT25917.1 hypothetical protein EDC34_101243 [Thermomonas haemolytica]